MDSAEGSRTFLATGEAYDGFMGRYSRPLAAVFLDELAVEAGDRVLDVGCGPGALTGELVKRLGATSVSAMDPSPPFVEACAARFPDVDVRAGRAEAVPFDDASFDAALAQLVLHFVTDPEHAARELVRVVRPGGLIAACVWDFDEEMEMLRHFWDAALDVDPNAPDEARVMRFGRSGEISTLFVATGLTDVAETALEVSAEYEDFDQLWSGFMAGIGPAGAYCTSLPAGQRGELRSRMFVRLGSPSTRFTLRATARCASGRRPV